MPDFLQIQGNLRQQYLPFTLEGWGKKQIFSFNPKREADRGEVAFGKINPFSSQLEKLFNYDSGIKYTHSPKGNAPISYKDFLNEIPAVQIREYVPDARLTQTFKWFTYLAEGWKTGVQGQDAFSFSAIRTQGKKLMDNLSKQMKDLTSGDASGLKRIVTAFLSEYADRGFNVGPDAGIAVLVTPFILYYRLNTTYTNNVYEFPYTMKEPILKSDGTYGWATTGSDFGILGKALNSDTGKEDRNMLQSFAKMLLGNTVNVNIMPAFNPRQPAEGSEITVNIDLINDTEEAALNNFIMCHTLFGNNRWLQYGFIQASSSLYDVKLPGANRYFMCSGRFTCTGKGAFRSPNDSFISKLLNHVKGKDANGSPKTMHSVLSGYLDNTKNNDLAKGLMANRVMSMLEDNPDAINDENSNVSQIISKNFSSDSFAKLSEIDEKIKYFKEIVDDERSPESKKDSAKHEIQELETQRNEVLNTAANPQSLINGYGSEISDEDLKELIKIPDAYSLTLTFKSLFPDNFNNYLYGFRAKNIDMFASPQEIFGVYEQLAQAVEKYFKQ